MEPDQREFPVDFSGEVRLFPLPNMVLYPGCVQPLHIFESRYCEMLEDAIRDDRLLAIATLMPGYETDYYSRPPIADHACVGQVLTHEKTPQGTYNLVLVGARRVLIRQEITPVRSYRRAFVDIIDDATVRSTGEIERRLGLALAQCLTAVIGSASQLVTAFREETLSLAMLTDMVAFHVPWELQTKLRLLEEHDPLERARTLLAAFESISSSRGPGDQPDGDESASDAPRFPPRFGHN